MTNNFLSLPEHASEDDMVNYLKPEFNRICYNAVRASIIHLLIKSKDLGYSMSVEVMSKKLGKRHSVIIHHLEKLEEWGIVNVVKSYDYGEKKKRSIWGLKTDNVFLIENLYNYMIKSFYTMSELEEMCSINTNVRRMS